MKYRDRNTQKLQYKHQQAQMFGDAQKVKTYNKSQLKKFTPRITKYVDPIWWELLSWENKWSIYSDFRSDRLWEEKLSLQDFCLKIDFDKWVPKSEIRERKLKSLF